MYLMILPGSAPVQIFLNISNILPLIRFQAMDPLMEYLETNLQTVYSSLEESICPRIIFRLWENVLDILNTKLLPGVRNWHICLYQTCLI